MPILDLTGKAIPTDTDLKMRQLQEALLIQKDFLGLALQLLADMVQTDGRECDQGGDLHTLKIDSPCPGCRARSFIDQLVAAGLVGASYDPGDTHVPVVPPVTPP